MSLTPWVHTLRQRYDQAMALYAQGHRDADSLFDPQERTELALSGLRPIHVFDYVEDASGGGQPDWETFLLLVAIRRDVFLFEQGGKFTDRVIKTEELPDRKAELGGIPWLPRILVKARGFLDGSLASDIMYCCGGDRKFFKTHGITPPDFLRVVRAATDDGSVLDYVRQCGKLVG